MAKRQFPGWTPNAVRRGHGDAGAATSEAHMVTCLIDDGYVGPGRVDATLEQSLEAVAENRTVLTIFPTPTSEQVAKLAEAWDLHPVLREDVENAHQRPKIERYGDVLFVVARAAKYSDDAENIGLAEFHFLVRPGSLALFCQDGEWFDGTSGDGVPHLKVFEEGNASTSLLDPNLLRLGPEAVLYRFLDAIVDGYLPVLSEIETDQEQIERQVFGGDTTVAERIYRLNQEVIDLRQAIVPLQEVLASLQDGFARSSIPEELRSYLDDVADHLAEAATRTAQLRESLSQILQVNATLVAQRQNEDMKKISGWAAILFAPTLVGAIYGMNFDDMPELHWSFGYPMAIGLMVGLGVLLYVVFKKNRWM